MNINSSEAYVVRLLDSQKTPIATYDTIAQGLRVVKDPTASKGAWGTVSWFDKISANMRLIVVKTPPRLDKENITITDDTNQEYEILLITKSVFDSIVTHILPTSPKITSNQHAQEYISSLNPYA